MQSQHDAILHTELHRIILELFISKPIHFLPHPMHNFSSIVFVRINQPCLKSFSEMNIQNTIHINICDMWSEVVAKFVKNLLLDLQFLNCQLSNLQHSSQQFCHAFIDGARSPSFIKLLQGLKKLYKKNFKKALILSIFKKKRLA